MPLDKTTRYHIEIATFTYLKMRYLKGKEATSEEILTELLKRRYKVALDLRQVAAICSSMKRRGAVFSRSQKGTTFWRINPNFHREHPGESLFVEHTPIMSLKEYSESLKRRLKKKPKKLE
jgi:hypothetical protein